jgi:transposase
MITASAYEEVVAVLSPPAFAGGTPTRSETQSNGDPKERTAMRSVGLDLGKREVSYCEVHDGKVIARRTAPSLGALDDLLGPKSPPARVAIEACREAWHVHDVLTNNGHTVLLIDTTRVKRLGVGHHGRKRDSIDAEVFAHAVEQRQIPLAHVLSPHRRELREKLNARRTLVETRACFVTTMRGVVRARGEKLAGCDTEAFRRTLARASLSEGARAAIAPLATVLETLDQQLSRVEVELEQLASQEPTIAQLTTTPGVDIIVASVFVSVVDEAKRFPNAHKLESYLGLVPREDTTGGRDKQKLGSITKCGNAYARAMLVQAAWCILRGRRADPLRSWAHGVERRRGKRIAVVALARRLAGVLWAMWRDGRPYDPARLGNASAQGLERAALETEAAATAMRTIAKKAANRAKRIKARLESDPNKKVKVTRKKTARPASQEVTL